MKQYKPQFVLISAELSTKSVTENYDRTIALQNYLNLHDIPYKKVVGCYKFEQEVTFLIPDPFDKYKWAILEIMGNYGQESYLHVDENRKATLYYRNGDIEKLGKFQEISSKETRNLENFTHDIETDKYYTCK